MERTVKKEKVLSAEEKLQQALVPVEEQPYPVPENWCWTRIKNLCVLKNGRAFKPTDWSESGLPIIRIQNLNNPDNAYNYFDGSISPENRLYGGELLFAWSGTPGTSFGAHIWYGKDAVLNQHIFRVDFNESCIDKIFFKYAINQQLDALIGAAHGGAGLQHVTKGVFEATPIAFPPLAEQHRIVSRIERLFAKLDEAREKAQAVVDGFEDRKAAILHKAFTGELSSQWRIKHNLTKDSWKECRLSEISTLQTGLMKGKRYSGKTVWRPYLRVANVQDGYLNLKEIKQIEVEESNLNRYLLQYGDVLFTEGGDYDKLGRGTVWHGEVKDCLHQNHVFVVRPNPNMLLPEFLSLQAGSQYGKRYFLSCSKQTTNLASINSTQLKNFPVLLPTIEEQRQIIGMVQNLLTVLEKSKDGVNNTLSQIDSIKKSILARAFRGTLGTNDPSDESAEELLKPIL